VVEAFSARFDGKPGWRQAAGTHPPEAHALTLSSDLARRELGWRPRLDLPDALSWTADWYRAHRAGADMPAICEDQIRRYGDLMKSMP
jgi:CDP-glucose 4,6-dehydratase